MANPIWGSLSLRVAAGARDQVATADLDGLELTSADRDALLNYAYQKYVALFFARYSESPKFLTEIFSNLIQFYSTVTNSVGNVDLTTGLPDYGFFIGLDIPTVDSVERILDPLLFVMIKDGKYPSKTPSANSSYYFLQYRLILVTPLVQNNTVTVAYLSSPQNITYVSGAGGTEIAITAQHFDSIVLFALAQHYRNKLEFQVADSLEKEAYASAPYPILAKEIANG